MASMSNYDSFGIKLFQIRALVVVADHGSFSEAAVELGVTQSSISHAIASLEDELGVKLLSRGRHGAVLTPVGEQIVVDARQTLSLINSIVQKANIAKGLDGGQVRLASLRSIATHILPKVMATFRQRFSSVGMKLTQYFYNFDIRAALRDGSADIGFLELPLPDDFDTYPLATDEYVALLPPSVTLDDQPLTWDVLSQYPLIMPEPNYDGSLVFKDKHGENATSMSALLRRHLETHAPSLNITYEINEDSIQVGMVEQGLGVAILPRLAAIPIPSTIHVRSLPTPFVRQLGAAMLKDRLQTPATFTFWDVLKECISEPHLP
jgi:DNA-binding transcriptional LysR family regulator